MVYNNSKKELRGSITMARYWYYYGRCGDKTFEFLNPSNYGDENFDFAKQIAKSFSMEEIHAYEDFKDADIVILSIICNTLTRGNLTDQITVEEVDNIVDNFINKSVTEDYAGCFIDDDKYCGYMGNFVFRGKLINIFCIGVDTEQDNTELNKMLDEDGFENHMIL